MSEYLAGKRPSLKQLLGTMNEAAELDTEDGFDTRLIFPWTEKFAAKKPTLPARMGVQAAQKDRELELWKRWKDSGETDQMVLSELFQSLAPLVRRISLGYMGNLPPSYIEGLVKQHVLIALKSFDPNKSQMNTHIQNTCRKVLREVYKYQNPTRLAEESNLRVPTYQNVEANLAVRYGRPPTALEIAREMGVGVTEVRRLRTGARRDLGAVEGQSRYHRTTQDKEQELLDLIMPELTLQQQQVLAYLYGRDGRPQITSAKEIAAKLNLSQGRVSQIKGEIADKVKYHFGGRLADLS